VSASPSAHDVGRILTSDFLQILQIFADQLELRESEINALNVFPVPDSDTGTNSLLTVQAGIMGLSANPVDRESLTLTVRQFAQFASANARGNSGTILAEYFRGLAMAVGDQADVANWYAGLQSAAKCAFEAVLNPSDGTILSVAQAVAKVRPTFELFAYLGDVTHVAKSALLRTTSQLAQLQNAQVVDAGACVLVLFHESVSSFYNNHQVNISFMHERTNLPPLIEYVGPSFELTFLLTTSKDAREQLRVALAELGESITIAGITPEFKVHIHTDEVSRVLDVAESLGAVSMITTTSLAGQLSES